MGHRHFLLGLLLLGSAARPAQAQAPVVAGRTAAEWRDDLRHPQPLVRQAAIEALLRFGAMEGATVAELTALVRDPDVAVRRMAIRGLTLAGPAARAAAAALETAWRTDTPLASADAAQALWAVAPDAVVRFTRAIGAADASVRARAAGALAAAPPRTRAAIHALRDALRDDDAEVRALSLVALAALDPAPGRTTAQRLRDLLQRELADDAALAAPGAADRVAAALGLLTRAGPHAVQARTVLRTLLHDAPVPVRPAAAAALVATDDGRRVLDRALVDGDAATREAALQALGRLGARRIALAATIDSLRAPGFAARDTARARVLLEALGRHVRDTRPLRRTLAQLSRDPGLAPAVASARRRLARDRD